MSGEIGFELQGPREWGQEIHDLLMEASEPFGIRRIGARVTMINHLEASYPTIATNYIPAIFDPELADYLAEFRASMPSFAQPAYIAGSYDAQAISEYYRSPVELRWGRNIKFDHDFLGREALEEDKAAPRRSCGPWSATPTMSRTCTTPCSDLVRTTTTWSCRGTSAASCGLTASRRTARRSASRRRGGTATTSAR